MLIAEASNLDLAEMAASAGVSYDVLAWTAGWYFREETLERANTAMVGGYHHRLPLAAVFGTGTLALLRRPTLPGVCGHGPSEAGVNGRDGRAGRCSPDTNGDGGSAY